VRQLYWFCLGLFEFSALFFNVVAVLSRAGSFADDIITLVKEHIPEQVGLCSVTCSFISYGRPKLRNNILPLVVCSLFFKDQVFLCT
jgi:hypothetical protein